MPSDTHEGISPDDIFMNWSKERGIHIDGIKSAQIPGRGRGIVAQRRVEAGEEIVRVPASALLTERSVPADFKLRYGDITIHGLLASFLASGHPRLEQYTPWAATWPASNDLKECMPMLWGEKLRRRMHVEGSPSSLLPLAIGCGAWAHPSDAPSQRDKSRGLLHEQEVKFGKDLVAVQKVFPDIDEDWYKYCWLVVNTRTFYYELPGLKSKRPKEDCMVMCPFIDLFNHADQGCHVAFDEKEYTVTTHRVYNPGEEIYVSYGCHSNDFLLLEYGFILERNKWDRIPIDDLLVPNVLSHKLRRSKLEKLGYLSNYTLTREGVCHRTQVAVRAMTARHDDFSRYISGRVVSDEARDRSLADSFIKANVLRPYRSKAENALQALYALRKDIVDESIRPVLVLIERWTQIDLMVKEALDNMEKG